LDKERDFQRRINIMWKFGGITRQRLIRKIKCSLKNFKMKMRSSKVAQDG